MTYTKNHHLPQWVSSDRIRMNDFNSAMANIESGMTANASKAGSALTAANEAKSAATAAQTAVSSAFSPENMPFVTGSYVGKGNDPVYAQFGFKPSFVIVSGMRASAEGASYDEFIRYFVMTSDNENVRTRLQLISSGFAVYRSPNNGTQYPNMNEAGRHYDYIAFR